MSFAGPAGILVTTLLGAGFALKKAADKFVTYGPDHMNTSALERMTGDDTGRRLAAVPKT